jgi:hypothetical protein
MRILSIGNHINCSYVTNVNYGSPKTILDYDVLIWNPNSLSKEYTNDPHSIMYKNVYFNKKDSANFSNDNVVRNGQINDFISLGRPIVILTPIQQLYNFSLDKGVHDIPSTEFLPIREIDLENSSGSNLEIVETSNYKEFFNKTLKYYYYKAIIRNNVGYPQLRIKGTDKIVASFYKSENSNILFLPQLLDVNHDDFIEALIELIDSLKFQKKIFRQPEWVKRFYLPNEQEEIANLDNLKVQLFDLQEKILISESTYQKIENNKILFSGGNEDLENQVETLFSEIGFEIIPTEVNRTDLIVKYGDRIAVIEIKGLTKSAGEKNSAQLEKWVSSYHLEKDLNPKGILIVNGFKDIPLDERVNPVFPDQMIKYSTNRNHCLMTGFQLLGLYYDIKANPGKKGELIDLLFNTTGIFKKYNWDEFIKLANIN